MSVTIFKDKKFKGPSQVVSNNVRDLKGMSADKPGSIKLSASSDEVLLYKNDDWHGGALFIRGKESVSDLGSPKEGGRTMFGNCIRSIRVTPFKVKLNITVVKNGDKFPGIWPSELWADTAVKDVVRRANNFYVSKQALLQMEIARITYRNNSSHFNLTKPESWKFPGDWKEKGEVDVIFVNVFEKEGVAGLAKFPCFGETVIVSVTANSPGDLDSVFVNEDMARILTHETGHHFGLSHGTADKDKNNLMFNDFTRGEVLTNVELWSDQIREMQDRLANNISRRGERIG
jgi:reprolysin-like metallo-peptidase family M12B